MFELLSIYASLLSTFLLLRLVRMKWLRWRVKRRIEEDKRSMEWQEFLKTHPPQPKSKMIEEEDTGNGEVIRGFEIEVEQAESEMESAEEREWRTEQMISYKRGLMR